MKTWSNLRKKVVEEYDRRNLKSDVRYKALDKIISSLSQIYGENTDCLSKEKQLLKDEYAQNKGKDINDAEKSAFNELIKQFNSI